MQMKIRIRVGDSNDDMERRAQHYIEDEILNMLFCHNFSKVVATFQRPRAR